MKKFLMLQILVQINFYTCDFNVIIFLSFLCLRKKSGKWRLLHMILLKISYFHKSYTLTESYIISSPDINIAELPGYL